MYNFTQEKLSHKKVITLGFKFQGKPIINLNYEPEQSDYIIGFIPVEEDTLNNIYHQTNELRCIEEELEKEIINYYESISLDAIQEMVTFNFNTIYNMAPGYVYIEEEIFSNFYDSNNLIQGKRDQGTFVFNELKEKDPTLWSFKEKKFIYNYYWLIKSGGPPRGELFNGFQLTCKNLHTFLDSKKTEYSDALSIDINKNEILIREKSETLSWLRNEMKKNHRFIRSINGLTVNKQEDFFLKSDLLPLNPETFPKELTQHIFDKFGLRITDFNDFEDMFYTVIQKGINMDRDGITNLSFLEELINLIIDLSVEDIGADVGMSRSLRNYKNFTDAIVNKDITTICNWTSLDYFCCVRPSLPLQNYLQDKGPLLSRILKAISVRMTFNSWHYMPGHFNREDIPEGRHFYFPPEMADTAIWSDQHHTGHVNAEVKYSIRSPESIVFKGKEYKAFFDLRLMRQRGNPFSKDDLKIAIFYTLILKNLYQALINYTSEHEGIVIDAYSKDWYNEYYGGK